VTESAPRSRLRWTSSFARLAAVNTMNESDKETDADQQIRPPWNNTASIPEAIAWIAFVASLRVNGDRFIKGERLYRDLTTSWTTARLFLCVAQKSRWSGRFGKTRVGQRCRADLRNRQSEGTHQ
jgi:hypothetical protein